MIEVLSLYHNYQGQNKLAVNNVSFNVEANQIFGFLGPSGAGKTTIQNLMTAVLPIQKGEITYQSLSIRNISRRFFNQVGYAFEYPNFYSKLTGYENLKYYAMFFNARTEDPLKLLEMVGLKADADKQAGNYSKGMKQRLIFARSIINNPKILFLDEPLAGLDPSSASVIKEIIKNKRKLGVTILLTTHDMHAADELCDVVAFINEGKIIEIDSPRNLKLKYGSQSVQVEYYENGRIISSVLFHHKDEDKSKLKEIIDRQQIQTMHTRESSLEDIFIRIAGRGLK